MIRRADKFWRFEEPQALPTYTWLAVLIGVVTTTFALMVGVEYGRGDVAAIQRLTYGQELQLPQHPGVWVRVIGDCDIMPPARCTVVQIVQLDVTQAAVVVEPFPMLPKKEN